MLAWLALTVAACTVALPGTPLAIDTAASQVGPSACGGVGLPPFRMERNGDTLRFVDVGTATERNLVWPHGFAARLVDGTAILYASNGAIIARENEAIEDAGGCPRSDGSILVDSFDQATTT